MDGPAENGDEVAITLHCAPLGRLRIDRRQLRLDGLFVETRALTLPPQSEVEVTLAIRHDDQLQVHKLNARVVGHSRHGTNLTFQHCRRETYHALRELVAQTMH